jgi:NAD(P)-dependent dehydrogenase (short-subunit alcohol dehydrogenase family)
MFDGRVALVTGAGSGIGRSSALAFAQEGAAVVVADVTDDGGQQTVDRIRDTGGDALFVRTDVSQATEVAALVQRTVTTYGRLDYAHNNASVDGWPGMATEWATYPEEAFDRVIAINLKGVWLCLQQEIPQLLAQGGGAIVNTASILGLRGGPNAAYTASKHGVVGLSKSAAFAYAGRGVRVNAVCPGLIQTPMIERIDQRMQEQFSANVLARSPGGRGGVPEEIAATVVWLCSDAAAFVTGVALPVDGGFTI